MTSSGYPERGNSARSRTGPRGPGATRFVARQNSSGLPQTYAVGSIPTGRAVCSPGSRRKRKAHRDRLAVARWPAPSGSAPIPRRGPRPPPAIRRAAPLAIRPGMVGRRGSTRISNQGLGRRSRFWSASSSALKAPIRSLPFVKGSICFSVTRLSRLDAALRALRSVRERVG